MQPLTYVLKTLEKQAPNVGPDVMQSGFGVNFLFWSGEFEENCRRISQRILMANFDSEYFGLVFPGFQATPKVHAQNSRPELSAFLSNFTFLFTAIFCSWGRPTNGPPLVTLQCVPALNVKMLLRRAPRPPTLTYVLLTYVLAMPDFFGAKGLFRSGKP